MGAKFALSIPGPKKPWMSIKFDFANSQRDSECEGFRLIIGLLGGPHRPDLSILIDWLSLKILHSINLEVEVLLLLNEFHFIATAIWLTKK